MEKISKQISNRRNKLGLFQSQVGQQAKMTQQQYQRIETGGECKLSSLERIAEAMNMELALIPNEKLGLVEAVLNASSAAEAMNAIYMISTQFENAARSETSQVA